MSAVDRANAIGAAYRFRHHVGTNPRMNGFRSLLRTCALWLQRSALCHAASITCSSQPANSANEGQRATTRFEFTSALACRIFWYRPFCVESVAFPSTRRTSEPEASAEGDTAPVPHFVAVASPKLSPTCHVRERGSCAANLGLFAPPATLSFDE